jgi:deazaflavin-dependent oxidoreductase (nitroreductase family)
VDGIERRRLARDVQQLMKLGVLLMPAGRRVARFNRLITNRILGPLAVRLPDFGVVTHTGRTSHRQYRNPVNVFQHGDRYVFALTYGAGADWVRNVLAAGECTLETRGRAVHLTQPRLFHDEKRQAVPPLVRHLLGVAHVDDFLELRQTP